MLQHSMRGLPSKGRAEVVSKQIEGINVEYEPGFPENERYTSRVEECHICERCLCRSCVSWKDCGDSSIGR